MEFQNASTSGRHAAVAASLDECDGGKNGNSVAAVCDRRIIFIIQAYVFLSDGHRPPLQYFAHQIFLNGEKRGPGVERVEMVRPAANQTRRRANR